MRRQKIRKTLILISFLLFPVTIYYLSPYVILLGAAQGIVAGSFLFFCLLFLGSLFLGRAFCGWLCPAGGFQDACQAIKDKRVKRGNWLKYVIWTPWLAMLAATFIRAGGLRRIDPFFFTTHGISVAEPAGYIVYYGVIGLLLLLALAVGKRSFCHHVCWMAPFMVIGRKLRNLFGWPALSLRAEASACRQCGTCTRNCPMSLEVQAMAAAERMENSECILCGSCVDGCPHRVIRYAWSVAGRREKAKKPANPRDLNTGQ